MAYLRQHAALIFWLIVIAFLRCNWLSMPLERDEGEYAYIGQLLLKGLPPFAEVGNMKLPGTAMMYALFMGIGSTNAIAIHAGLMLVSLISMCLIYSIGSRMFNPRVGWLSAAFYGCLGLMPMYLGFAAHATHFVVLFVLLGIYWGVAALETPQRLRSFAMGVAFGIAIIMKQSAILFPFVGVWMIAQGFFKRRPLNYAHVILHGAFFALGVILPYAALVTWIYQAGTFDAFWRWTIEYAPLYASGAPLFDSPQFFLIAILRAVFLLPALWALLWFINHAIGDLTHRRTSHTVFLYFCLLPIGLISTGWSMALRQHYYIQIIPALALCFAVWIDHLCTYFAAKYQRPRIHRFAAIPPAIFALALCVQVLSQSPAATFLETYGPSHAQISDEIAANIRTLTPPNEPIAILGSEPQLYFLSDRPSAVPYLYTYPMMEVHPFARTMQDDMIAQIETKKPALIVYVGANVSWLKREKSDMHIVQWATDYLKQNYTLVSVYDAVFEGDPGIFTHFTTWQKSAESPAPPAYKPDSLLIYIRNPTP